MNGNRIGSATNQTYVATVSGNYTVIVTSLNCSSAASAGTPVTVNPTPSATANPSSQTICSANTITTIALSGNVSGTTYNWTRNNTVSVTGIAANGSGNISGALTNTTNAPVTVTFTITPTANGCAGTAITATVLVNPKALVNAVPNQVVCNNTSTTAVSFSSPTTGGTIVYNWTNNTASIGLATSGSGNISAFTATNTTAAPITATITVTPSFTNGVTCIGTPITFTITVRPSIQSCNITPVPSNNVYTGGVPTNIYLGYGPQSVKLSTSAIGGNPFTYSWTGNGTLSCTNCAAPVFTPSAAGTYNFVVTITNSFGCKKTCRITICVLDIRVPGTNGAYVYICHYSNGKPPTQTIQVGINAVPTHIYSPGHGDRLGKCNDVPCGSNARYVNAIETKGPEQIIYNDFKMLVSPNPLSSSATIHYVLPENAHISLGVYNQLGQKVKQLAEGNMIAGNHYQKFDATKLAAGIYFCHLLTITADGKLIELNEKLVVAK